MYSGSIAGSLLEQYGLIKILYGILNQKEKEA